MFRNDGFVIPSYSVLYLIRILEIGYCFKSENCTDK